MYESRVLDDAARVAGVNGPGYPIRAGKETFYLGRLTKEVRNRWVAWSVQHVEQTLREMAALYPVDEYGKAVRDYHRAKNQGDWFWHGDQSRRLLASNEGGLQLVLLLLLQHHPEADEDLVQWLLLLWSCPSCGWRGLHPEKPAGTRCGSCKSPTPGVDVSPAGVSAFFQEVMAEVAAGDQLAGTSADLADLLAVRLEERAGKPTCCRQAKAEEFYHCPGCGVGVLESLKQDQLAAAIRELSSADPRMPHLGAARPRSEPAVANGLCDAARTALSAG